MTRGNYSEFPPIYRQNHNPAPDETFLSRHLLKQSVVVDSETGTRKSVVSTKACESYADVKTLADLLENGLKRSRFLPCLGTRTSTEAPYEWMLYKEVDDSVRAFGSALLEIVGLKRDGNSFVGIYSRNCPAWVITMHACAAYSYVYVPLYDTLGKEAMRHIMNQTQLEVLVCHSAKEATVATKEFGSMLKCVIITQETSESKKLQSEYADRVRILHFNEFIAIGDKKLQLKRLPHAEDLCTLCYTSGSTGVPKGVMLQHGQLVDSIMACIAAMDGKYLCQATMHMAYLPLAHIMEQLFTNAMILVGASEGFLTGGPETLLADARDLKPTILTAVPRVLSKLRAEYYKKVPKNSFMRNALQRCIQRKNAEQARGKFDHSSIWDTLFFKKFRRLLGGRVGGVICGGAPLVSEVSIFIRAALGCPVTEGYGCTETTGLLTFTLLGESETAVAGAIAPNMEIKLADVPEMGINFERDQSGEICARGMRCTKGYYKDPENTAKLLDDEGWLHTGDVAEWTAKGGLRVVDRCKNMFKLTQGEYIASEKVEGIYQCCPLVSLALLDGSSERTYAVVVIHPELTVLREEAVSKGLIDGGRKSSLSNGPNANTTRQNAEICQNIEMRKLVLKQINELGRERGLKGFELAKNIHLTPEPFTIENGLLTPTLKLARFNARNVFRNAIEELYNEGELAS